MMTNENQLEQATIGRVVHFVIETNHGPRCRPGIVVEDWPESGRPGYVNLQVWTDGTNDGSWGTDDHDHAIAHAMPDRTARARLPLSTRWETSVLPNQAVRAVRTWHWPRLCTKLETAAEDFLDFAGIRYHHNHVDGMDDPHNCPACGARVRDEKNATLRK